TSGHHHHRWDAPFSALLYNTSHLGGRDAYTSQVYRAGDGINGRVHREAEEVRASGAYRI
ncbi:MAG: hypothetical protein QGI79_04255, partial [Dehalococcoidia bacterium]|nr:hypothetical protein [Dehalococcoidia bacterium]